MIAIISDLHLTDGTSGQTVREGAFHIFRDRLRDLAYDASWRADGKYKPIDEVHLVLLGDILDVLRSTRWLDEKPGEPGFVRPWDHTGSPELVRKIRTITQDILQHNTGSFALLKALQGPQGLTLPPATPDGKTAKISGNPKAERVPIPVHIHYMVGNHDWFFHLPNSAYDPIRKTIIEALGLDNDPALPFPHDPEEPAAARLRAAYKDHAIFARHGDIFDPFNYAGDRNRASLGDAVVVDLVDAFSFAVKRDLGNALPSNCLEGLKEIDNVRPLLLIPVWIGALLQRTCPDSHLRRRVKAVWNDLAGDFARIPFVREQHRPLRFDAAGKLVDVLQLSKWMLGDEPNNLLSWVVAKIGAPCSSYSSYALGERAYRSGAARRIIYGHTHHYEHVPLDTLPGGRGNQSQVYLNSGTWRPLHELARSRPFRKQFVEYHALTYLAFFKPSERGGRGYESWSGVLAIP
jgi:UDP-2,3-diacylglucosamine pyrophosphatase LpxH